MLNPNNTHNTIINIINKFKNPSLFINLGNLLLIAVKATYNKYPQKPPTTLRIISAYFACSKHMIAREYKVLLSAYLWEGDEERRKS